jgi:predicted phosphodiesterase
MSRKPQNLAERLAAVEKQAEHEDAVRTKVAPSGWEPGVVWDGKAGTITTDTLYETPEDWSDLLRSRGLDPDKYEVVGDTIKWCSYDGWKRENPEDTATSCICYSFKADIRLKSKHAPIDLEELYKEVRKKKKSSKEPKGGEETFLVCLSDWQVGNRDGGGVERQAAKIADLVDSIPDRIADLRRGGHNIGHIVVAGLGDLGEGTCGHYPAQQFRIEVDRREQLKIVRRGIRDIVMGIAPLASQVTVTAVGGNHGENRGLNGKAFTTTGDNDDVAVFEQVAEIFAANPDAYGHVSFRLPLERLTLSLSLSGHIVAFTHGHLSKPSGNAAQSMWNWWKDQTLGRAHPGVADADILIAGHYHHLNVKEQEGRAVFIAPSLVAVGEYFQDSYGVKTREGTLSMVIAPDGWGELHLIN